MRVLFLPLIGATTQVFSESGFANFRQFWRAGKRIFPQFYGHIYVPTAHVKVVTEALTDEERTYLEVRAEPNLPKTYHVQECGFHPAIIERFSRYVGRTWVDVVITARTVSGHSLHTALRDWRGVSGAPTVALWEPGIEQDFFAQGGEAEAARRAKAMSMAVCPTTLLSKRELELAHQWGRKFLSHQMVAQLMERVTFLQPRIKSHAPDPAENPKKHTMYFSGRLNSTKRIDFIAGLYAKVFALGYGVDIRITTPTKVKPRVGAMIRRLGKGPDGNSLVDLVGSCPLEEFKSARAAATIVVFASSYEGFPFGFLEVATSGPLALFPEEPWARAMVPKDYPWFYKTERDALVLIRRALHGEWKAMVREQLRVLRTMNEGEDDIQEARWKWWTNPKWIAERDRKHRIVGIDTEMGQFIDDFVKTKDDGAEPFDLHECLMYVTELTDSVRENTWLEPPARFWSMSSVHVYLTEVCGLVDDCTGMEPQYRRIE